MNAIYNFSTWDNADQQTVDALMKTCKAISDELFPILFCPDETIHNIDFTVIREKYLASTSWLITGMRTSLSDKDPCTWSWPKLPQCEFLIRDLDDPKLRFLVRRPRVVQYLNVTIGIPQLAAEGRSKAEDLAVIWSKVRDIATLMGIFRSVRYVNCSIIPGRSTELDRHRFFHCPVKVNQETFRSSLYSLIMWALADVFIKKYPFSKHRMPTAPVLNITCIENLPREPWCRQWVEPYANHIHPENSCHDAARIAKTVKEGLCVPQSLPKRFLSNMMSKKGVFALTEYEVMQLRHEMRTLSIAVDAVIDTCRGRAANMLRLHRFATWDSPETDGMSVAAQHNLLRGAGPQDRTISNRETLMKILKPAGCDGSSYPVDTWYDRYPQGIEPLDLLAKRHRESFEEEPEFQSQEITYPNE